MVPTEFCHTPIGLLIVAEVAFPPSPVEDVIPVPTAVRIINDGIADDTDEKK
jgi:hypothetical protein